jgi:hypothetical protein
LEADAETIQAKGRPDVLVSLNGIKLVVEGRHHKQGAALRVDAKTRIQKGIGEISLAVEYNDALYEGGTAALQKKIENTQFDGSIFYFASSSIQEKPFTDTSLEELSLLIRSAFLVIVQNDVVRQQVSAVEKAIEEAVVLATTTNLFFKSNTVREKLKAALAIDLSKKKKENGEEEE